MTEGSAQNHARIRELAQRIGPSARLAEPLAGYTSLRVGGPADCFVRVSTTEALRSAVDHAVALGIPWRVIGAGSNLLIADDGVAGLVVKMGSGVATLPEGTSHDSPVVRAQAGCILASLSARTAQAGYAGLEWAVNVPGTVGAAVVNNAGAFGSCTAEHLDAVTLYLPEESRERDVGPEELEMTYRSTRLKRGELRAVVLAATFRLEHGDRASLAARLAEIRRQRRTTQPGGYSLGSIFANPPGDAAGRLLDEAGLKGVRVGGAQVASLHANFILNVGGATAQDVLSLMRRMREAVQARFGVPLVPEVEMVGRWRTAALSGARENRAE